MRQIRPSRTLASIDAKTHKQSLLQIANYDPAEGGDVRVVRSKLMKLRAVARALAFIVELLLMRVWDRTFLFDEGRIFMRFTSGDLLDAAASPVSEILPYLRVFHLWRDARLTLAVPAVLAERTASESARSREAIEDARRTLSDIRATRSHQSNANLDEAFSRWMHRCARAEPFTFMAGSIDGDVESITLPHRERIVDYFAHSGTDSAEMEQGMSYVLSVEPMKLTTTASGMRLLTRCRNETSEPSPGDLIIYSKPDKISIKRWLAID